MKKLFFISILLFFISCSSSKKGENEVVNQSEIETPKDYWTANNCLRGVPTSTLYSKELKSYKFELQRDKGVEIAVWKNGDSLIVNNQGCEVFWMQYEFYINNNELKKDIDLIRYCFQKVDQIDLAPVDFRGGMDLFDRLIANDDKIELRKEYFLKEENVSEMFQIDEVRIYENKSKVVFSFAIGNL